MPNGGSEKERITALEVETRLIKETVINIRDNHLHEIKDDMAALQKSQSGQYWLLVAILLISLFGPEALEKLKGIL